MNYPIAQYAIGQWGIDLSTPDYFQELLKRPSFDIIYLVEFEPYDDTTAFTASGNPPVAVNAIGAWGFSYMGGVRSVYFSDKGYMTNGSDTPAHTNYKPLTTNPLQIDVSVFNGVFSGRSGSFGAIRLLNGDGDLDDLTNMYWSGRNVKVYAGSKDFTRAQFVKVFDGLCDSIEHNEDEIIINIQNNEKTLESEFIQNIYDGSGGLDGGSDLDGKLKPLLYGQALRITPVLVDAANLIYQIHDGSVQEITAVYDRGVALSFHGDVADITANPAPPAGKYHTQLSGGYIRLHSSPDGQITVDAKGDNLGGYVSKSGQIVTRLLRTKLGLFNLTDADIDQGAFNQVDIAVPANVGVYISEKTTVRNVIDSLLTPIQCYWTYDGQGLITAGVGKEPIEPMYVLDDNNIIDGEFKAVSVYTPSWRVNIGYARGWTNQSEIATGASEAYRDFAQQEYRKVIIEDRNIRTISATSIEQNFNTLIVNETDAIIQAQRISELYSKKRTLYRALVKDVFFRIKIGDTVTVILNRFGLDAGKDLLIVGISYDAETNLTELELWG